MEKKFPHRKKKALRQIFARNRHFKNFSDPTFSVHISVSLPLFVHLKSPSKNMSAGENDKRRFGKNTEVFLAVRISIAPGNKIRKQPFSHWSKTTTTIPSNCFLDWCFVSRRDFRSLKRFRLILGHCGTFVVTKSSLESAFGHFLIQQSTLPISNIRRKLSTKFPRPRAPPSEHDHNHHPLVSWD